MKNPVMLIVLAVADYIENVLENTSMMPAFGHGGVRRREGGAPPPQPGEAP